MPQTLSFGLPLLLAFSFLANLPLGWLREAAPRYSWRWFLYIHLSIPLIVALRLVLDYSWKVIPLTLGCAVLGQLIGGRARRRYLP